MLLAIFALAYGETVDSKWRAQIEEKFEETLRTIQNNKNRIEKQSDNQITWNNKVEGCLTVHLKMERYYRQ